jgi:hypothetical protein
MKKDSGEKLRLYQEKSSFETKSKRLFFPMKVKDDKGNVISEEIRPSWQHVLFVTCPPAENSGQYKISAVIRKGKPISFCISVMVVDDRHPMYKHQDFETGWKRLESIDKPGLRKWLTLRLGDEKAKLAFDELLFLVED